MSISYNIHKEDGDLKGHVKRLAPNVLLVLANYGLAHDLAVANPQTQVIFRPYYGRDDLYNFMSANQFVAYCRQNWQGEPNIWFHTNNEAGMSPEMFKWEMSVFNIAPAGMKFVFGNPATGTFPDSVEGWKYAHEYIKFCIDHRDRIMLGLHEYFDVTPTITMPFWLQRRVVWGGFPNRPAYHCGRYQWLTDYCDMFFMGVYPKIVITEAGNDDLTEGRDGSDVNEFLQSLGFKPRGWRTLIDLWQRWYQMQADIVYFNMFKWLMQNVYNHPAIVGLCIFAWTSDDAPQWGMFNVSTATSFRNLNEAYSAKPTIPNKFYVVTSTYTTNVRASASTTDKIVKKITKGALVEVAYKLVNGNWFQVWVDGIAGYIRQDAVELQAVLRCTSTAPYGVNVRNGGATGAVLATIRRGDVFYIVGSNELEWVNVIFKGFNGWSYSSILDYQETP